MATKTLPLPVQRPNGDNRPNFIIFMPDQLRYDALGCTQSSSSPSHTPKTPNIDAFRRRGSLFTECYVQASVCAQSRCSMLTGTYPHVSGHRSLNHLIKAWEPNVFRSLRERGGYHVACLAPRGDTFAPTVTELSVDEYGFVEPPEVAAGWEKRKESKQKGEEPERTTWDRLFYKGRRDAAAAHDYDEAVIRSALAWLECPPQDRPWVLYLPLLYPHCPFQVEEPYFSLHDRDAVGDAKSQPAAKTGYEPRYMKAIRERYGLTEDKATSAMWREVRATYHGMVSRLDAQFGRLIAAVDRLGLWDSTVTLFFTDHGEYLGDHGLIEKWPSGLSESLVREPLIVAGGGLPEGRTINAMAEMVDLVPTLLELAGVEEHFSHNGLSWASLLLAKTEQHKEYAFSEGGFLRGEEPLLEQAPFPYDLKAALQHEDTTLVGKAVALRSPHWTYIYRLYEPPELYNRDQDPEEMHNLAALPQHADLVDELQRQVLRWLLATADVMPWTMDPRWPEVDLKKPVEQLEERLRQAGKEWEVICR